MNRPFLLPLLLLLLLLNGCAHYQPVENYTPAEETPNELSQRFLETLRAGGDAGPIVEQIAGLDPNRLAAALDSRQRKLAFWVNTYNGMVQYLLTEDPSRYDDRNEFFKTPAFTVAGQPLSPNEMEHAIIRGGENRLGLGYVPQLFPSKFERTFAVDGGDSRVHFALNCGAASCPPVEVYQPDTYDQQIDDRVASYLNDHTTIEEVDGKRTIVTSPLFQWFKGDFRDHDGVDDFLVKHGIVPAADKNLPRDYGDYDWTLKTGIWAK